MAASVLRLVSALLGRSGLAVTIGVVTFVIYSPALPNQFLDWDDSANFLNNPHFRGLGWEQLRWMFTTFLMGHWIPLTWITFGLDYLVWGMNPIGYHLTNILLHAANAAAFYFVAYRLLAKAMTGFGEIGLRLGAATAALSFALHPLRAESVAWVTERRDVLSGLFFLLTILTYLNACDAQGATRRRWLGSSVGCYILALASKSIVMTLPFVLIVIDAFPLGRIGGRLRDWFAPQVRQVWKEKVPYLLLSLIGGAIALYAVRTGSSPTSLEKLPLLSRVAIALWSFCFYVWKTVLPQGLSPLYELRGPVDPLALPLLGSAIAVGILSAGLFLLRRRWPAGLAVWLTYIVMLLPVSGLFHDGGQLAADRYSYLSCLGWTLLAGAAVAAMVRGATGRSLTRPLARAALAATAAWIIGLGALTWNQVQIWRDPDTLWSHSLQIDPDCAWCHNNLGVALGSRGLFPPAIEHFERAVASRPHLLVAHHNLGFVLLRVGDPARASEHFQRVLSEDSGNVDVRAYLGEALVQQRTPGEAVPHLELVIRQNPTHMGALTHLGIALVELGRPMEAIPYFQRAIALHQNAPLPRLGLARAYLALGNTAAAQEQSEVLRRLNPRLAGQLPPPTSAGSAAERR